VSEAEVSEFIDLKSINNNKSAYEIGTAEREQAIKAIKWFVNNTAQYTKEHPLISSMGDKIHFQPNIKSSNRISKKQAYIENALHFITQRKNGDKDIRFLAQNKLDVFDNIVEAVKNPDKRYKDNAGNLIYFKTLKNNKRKDYTIILHVDREGKVKDILTYRTTSGMPGLGEKGAEKLANR
jgi:hypothetical protein